METGAGAEVSWGSSAAICYAALRCAACSKKKKAAQAALHALPGAVALVQTPGGDPRKASCLGCASVARQFSGRGSERLACEAWLGSFSRDLLSHCSRASQSLLLQHLFSSGAGGGGGVGG